MGLSASHEARLIARLPVVALRDPLRSGSNPVARHICTVARSIPTPNQRFIGAYTALLNNAQQQRKQRQHRQRLGTTTCNSTHTQEQQQQPQHPSTRPFHAHAAAARLLRTHSRRQPRVPQSSSNLVLPSCVALRAPVCCQPVTLLGFIADCLHAGGACSATTTATTTVIWYIRYPGRDIAYI